MLLTCAKENKRSMKKLNMRDLEVYCSNNVEKDKGNVLVYMKEKRNT
jgi:hypothetical protein